MPMLVTLEETKAALRIYHEDDDTDLLQIIGAASEEVIAYLDTRAADVIGLDDDGNLPNGAAVPDRVKRATMIICQELYEGDDDMKTRPGGIPLRAEMLLYRLADPPFA